MSTRYLGVASLLIAGLLACPPTRGNETGTELKQELDRSIAEYNAISGQINESAALRQSHEQRFSELEAENNRLSAEASELSVTDAELQAQRSTVSAVCGRTVPQNLYAAAVAQCNAAKSTFNSNLDLYNNRVRQHNFALNQWRANYSALASSEQSRAAEAQQLLARQKGLAQQINSLQQSLRGASALPAGAQDCGNRTFCPKGTSCTGTGKCITAGNRAGAGQASGECARQAQELSIALRQRAKECELSYEQIASLELENPSPAVTCGAISPSLTQKEAFSTCYRTYVCAIRAAKCVQRRATADMSEEQCHVLSNECLAENPVPK